MTEQNNKQKRFYFTIGVALGLFLSAALGTGGLFALKYFEKGVGLGQVKSLARKFLKQAQKFKPLPSERYDAMEELPVDYEEPDQGSLADTPDRHPTGNILAFVASSLDRVFQDGQTLNKPLFSKDAAIALARNEYESFQVLVKSQGGPLLNTRIQFKDLKGVDGVSVLSQDNFSWRKVDYVPTIRPYYKVKFVGEWPDPLMPVEPFDMANGQLVPLWITIYIPEGTPAGVYKGNLEVQADHTAPQTVPISVRVYDFDLPVAASLKTAFDFYPHILDVRFPQQKNETKEEYQYRLEQIADKFILTMLKYRMNPVLNLDPRSDKEMARVDRYLVNGLNNFSIGKKGGTLGNNWPKDEQELEALLPLYRTYGELLKLNRMMQYHYIYTWDEEGDVGFPMVKKVTNMVHRAHPELKNMTCFHGMWDPDESPDWGSDIDIWCTQISDFDPYKAKKLKDKGMDVWFYASGPSNDGTPNLAMDFDSIDYRIIPWMAWRFDLDGFLYWCVNWWLKADPYKTAANTKWEQNANGLLFYPGTDGPIASLRAEIFRDGMEDYEYLTILRRQLALMKMKGLHEMHDKLFASGLQLIRIEDKMIRSMKEFSKDKMALIQRRNKIAETIEKIGELLIEKDVKL